MSKSAHGQAPVADAEHGHSQIGHFVPDGLRIAEDAEQVPGGRTADELDWLIEHPDQIPESWKQEYVFFWGTIYCNSVGRLCVRYIFWCGGRWFVGYYWLDCGWFAGRPTSVPAR